MRAIARKERIALVSVLGATVVLGLLVGLAAATGSIAPQVVGPPAPIALHAAIELSSGSPQTNGGFGSSSAVAKGDAVVGAPYETDAGFVEAGNVYVYNSATGHLVATIASLHPKLDGMFGNSVAMSGTTLVVGAPNETAGAVLNAGNAYVYTISGATVTYKCTLVDPTPFAGSSSSIGGAFGWSVAISGSDVLVGAPGENAGGLPQAGNAYLFSTGCSYLGSLTTLNPATDGVYGYSVALSGTTAYIGAPNEGNGGHVYLVLKATSAPADRTTYVLASPNAQSGFGAYGVSLAVGGTVLAVGARSENVSGVYAAGNAYLYNDSTGILTAQLINPSPQYGGYFGYSVAVSGVDVVVGAPNDAAFGAPGAGNVTVFNATTGGVLTTLTSPNFQNDGGFGSSVAADGACIVVGAAYESVGADTSAGHAYIY
jgi:FG-GAP repeat